MSTYIAPKQHRAKESESKFLDALDEILQHQSFGRTTIQEVANRAGLHKGAFLKRFGTKRGALIELFERYCLEASDAMLMGHQRMAQHTELQDLCVELSQTLEALQRTHFSANRAMHEYFMEELEAAPQTKRIFKELVDLMQAMQGHYLADQHCTTTGAYAAAQLMVTLNYNYVLQAMPGLPRDDQVRHQLIANLIIRSLWT